VAHAVGWGVAADRTGPDRVGSRARRSGAAARAALARGRGPGPEDLGGPDLARHRVTARCARISSLEKRPGEIPARNPRRPTTGRRRRSLVGRPTSHVGGGFSGWAGGAVHRGSTAYDWRHSRSHPDRCLTQVPGVICEGSQGLSASSTFEPEDSPGVRHTFNHPVAQGGFSDGSKPISRRKSKRSQAARIGCRDGRGKPDAPDLMGDSHLSKYFVNFIIQRNEDFENFGKHEIKEFLTIVPRPGQFMKTYCSRWAMWSRLW
jgi:hypothetical protein